MWSTGGAYNTCTYAQRTIYEAMAGPGEAGRRGDGAADRRGGQRHQGGRPSGGRAGARSGGPGGGEGAGRDLAAVAIVTAGGAPASLCAAVAAAAISCAVVVVAAATPAAATAPSSVARPAAVAATATSCAIAVIAAAATAATCRTGRHTDARGWTGHCARWHGRGCGHGPSRRGVRRTRRCSSGEHGRGDGEQRATPGRRARHGSGRRGRQARRIHT